MEFKWFAILIIGVMAICVIGGIFSDKIRHEEKMTEKGYEQVEQDGKILWQKRK